MLVVICVLEANDNAASLKLLLNDWNNLGACVCVDDRLRLDGLADADWGRDAVEAGTDWWWVAVNADMIRVVGNAGFGSAAVEVIIGMVARLVVGDALVVSDAVEEHPPILRSRGVRAPPFNPGGVVFPSFTPGEIGGPLVTQG